MDMTEMQAQEAPQSGIEHKPTPPLKQRFTKENARHFAKRGWEVRRERARKLNGLAELGVDSIPQSEALCGVMNKLAVRISSATSPDVIAKLTASYARLFKMWQVLSGTPNPGQRKTKGGRAIAGQVAPLQPLSIGPRRAEGVTSGPE